MVDERLEKPVLTWSRGVQHYASVAANLTKDFWSTTPDALGARIHLATATTAMSVAPKDDKVASTLEHCALWVALADEPGGWTVPFSWLESLNGSLGWLGQFYRRIRLLRRPVGVLMHRASLSGGPVVLRRDDPATVAVRRILALAAEGALRPVSYFPSASLAAASLSVTSAGLPPSKDESHLRDRLHQALQAWGQAGPAAGADLLSVASTSSDAGVDGSEASWGLVVSDGDSPPVVYHAVVSAPGADSGTAELFPIVDAARRCFPRWRRRLVVIRTDNLGNVLRISKASCRPESPAFASR